MTDVTPPMPADPAPGARADHGPDRTPGPDGSPRSDSSPTRTPEPNAEQRAESLKERIYVTFTALAIVLTLQTHPHGGVGEAALTLLIGVVGTLLAVFLADFLSHLTVHAHVPTGPEFRHMVAVSLGAIAVIVVPMALLGLAALGLWGLPVALGGSIGILLATLVVVGYLAVRRIRLPAWQKLLIMLGELVVGAAVIALELLAH
ncbi:hypothetical protein [Frondihabitans australicus]|uniref:Uncharacterized protein n=1 Tax=Frondihabitans australicus TaxID=386892 RepID=A0A495IEB1_9MICO|nr:hypothetical protein [Frondihabitans australicus]RKR73465.1 hypothetical protein C8E83_0558 [Frondihabitans australicus]